MNTPVLDQRTKEDIIKRIRELSGQYLPEWRFDGAAEDPASALADIFSDMFSQSIDRYNAIPQKLYTEFLNLLGVQEPPTVPASGIMSFEVHENVEDEILVPEGTLVYLSDEESGDNIVYETERSIVASPAELKSVYYSDTVNSVIQKLDLTGPQPFFGEVHGENLQKHRLTIAHQEALNMSGPGVIEIEFYVDNGSIGEGVMKQLADPQYAVWSYFSNGEYVPFDRCSSENAKIILTKSSDHRIEPDEDGRFCVYLDMHNMNGSIKVDQVRLRSIPDKRVEVEEMICNDMNIEKQEGGYCFGKIPAPYDSFYIRSDEVFSKRGSKALLKFDMNFIVRGEVDAGPQYDFDRSIIDKESVVSVKLDDVYVRNVVWEYFNGVGWSLLEVSGNKNLFSSKDTGSLEVSFTIPENIRKVTQTTEEGYFIRARVVDIENQYTTIPRYIVPFVKNIHCSYQYDNARAVEYLRAENNGSTDVIEDAEKISDLNMSIFRNMNPWPRSMYLCFDSSPHGMPLSLMFDINGSAAPESKINCEVWDGREFRIVPMEDNTDNFEHSGILSIYIQDVLPKAEFFAENGCWIRLSLAP